MGGLSSWMFGIWADIWVGLPLAALVGLVIGRLVLICVLPLDFHGRLRVVRDPCALHVLRPFLLMIACCGVSPWLVLVLCSMCQIVLGDVTQLLRGLVSFWDVAEVSCLSLSFVGCCC